MQDKSAYVQSIVSVSAGSVAWLPQLGLVMSIIASTIGAMVGCTALYTFYKNWKAKNVTDK